MSYRYARPITLMQPERLVFPPGWVGHIPFAFWIVEQTRPRLFVELGTHTGNSFGAFVQAANRLSLEGRFVAVDHWRGDEHAGSYAEDTFEEVSRYFESKYSSLAELMRMNFDDAVENFENGSIDLLHIDGFHTYEAVKHDFETWLPKMSGQGIVLLHDTAVRERDFGVFRLMEELARHYPAFEFVHSNGLGVVQTGSETPDTVGKLIRNKADSSGVFARDYFSRIGNALVGQVFTEILLGQPLYDKPLEAGLADVMWRKREVESENEHLRAVRAHFSDEKERFVEDGARLREAVAALTAENKKQVAAREDLTAQYAELTAEKDRLAVEAERLVAEQARLAAEQNRLLDENEHLRAERVGLTAEIDRLVAEARTQEGLLTLAGDCLAENRATLLHRLRLAATGHDADGPAESRETLPFFDPDYYLDSNPDVAESGIDPLLHYLAHGRREGRLPRRPAAGENAVEAIPEAPAAAVK